MQSKNEEFQQKNKIGKERKNFQSEKLNLQEEFIKIFDFGDDLVEKIYEKKGKWIILIRYLIIFRNLEEIIKMRIMIRKQLDFCVKVKVTDEFRKFFLKSLKENEEIMIDAIKN